MRPSTNELCAPFASVTGRTPKVGTAATAEEEVEEDDEE
jgi:hypothetical protein